MSDENRKATKMNNLLLGLSVDELEVLRPLLLKELEWLDESEVAQHCANELINLVIQIKQAESGVIQCKSLN